MNLEIDKIKNSALYLAKNITDLYFTKYLKLMYYFDFVSVLERGEPVTNDTYYHLPYGPVPTFIKDNLSWLKEELKQGEAEMVRDSEIGPESVKSIFSDLLELRTDGVGSVIVNKIDPNLQYLSQYEKGLLDDIISEFKATPTKTLVNKTHAETPYMQTPPNNVINYKLAFYLDRSKILPKRTYPLNPEVSQAEFFNK